MKIVLVIGENSSGKSTFTKGRQNALTIELGDLVREYKNTEERVFDNTLDDMLFTESKKLIDGSNCDICYIIGLRQTTLFKRFQTLSDEVHSIYLQVPRHILKERFKERAAAKDVNLRFEQVIEGDEFLGMKELREYLLLHTDCQFIKYY